eukprot:4504902-Pyramimonas_sp.AAC.1
MERGGDRDTERRRRDRGINPDTGFRASLERPGRSNRGAWSQPRPRRRRGRRSMRGKPSRSEVPSAEGRERVESCSFHPKQAWATIRRYLRYRGTPHT